MEKLERFRLGTQTISADEREALKKAMQAAMDLEDPDERARMFDLITEIGAAKARTIARRTSDRRTDAARRKLIGARLPKEQADRCKACAEAQGVSLYRFVVEALERACDRAEAGAEPGSLAHRGS